MQVYEGSLIEGGVSSADGRWKKYTYLKIGNQQINNVRIDMKFDRVLHGQIDRGTVKLWIERWFSRNIIIGITQSDGQTFRQGLGVFYSLLFFSLALGTIFLLVSFAKGGSLALVPAALLFLTGLIPWSFIKKVRSIKSDHTY